MSVILRLFQWGFCSNNTTDRSYVGVSFFHRKKHSFASCRSNNVQAGTTWPAAFSSLVKGQPNKVSLKTNHSEMESSRKEQKFQARRTCSVDQELWSCFAFWFWIWHAQNRKVPFTIIRLAHAGQKDKLKWKWCAQHSHQRRSCELSVFDSFSQWLRSNSSLAARLLDGRNPRDTDTERDSHHSGCWLHFLESFVRWRKNDSESNVEQVCVTNACLFQKDPEWDRSSVKCCVGFGWKGQNQKAKFESHHTHDQCLQICKYSFHCAGFDTNKLCRSFLTCWTIFVYITKNWICWDVVFKVTCARVLARAICCTWAMCSAVLDVLGLPDLSLSC